jgi:hypothetical protein
MNASAANVSGFNRWQQLHYFWVGVTLFSAYQLFSMDLNSPTGVLCGTFIVALAAYPVYLWCSGKVMGFPILPAFSFHYVFAYGVPLISGSASAARYQEGTRMEAGLTTVVFLAVVTAVWAVRVFNPPPARRTMLIMGDRRTDRLFLFYALLGVSYTVVTRAGWLDMGSWTSVASAVFFNGGALSAVVLCYRLGDGKLEPNLRTVVPILIGVWVTAFTSSLILIVPAGIMLLCFLAYMLGSKRIPTVPAAVAVGILAFLHQGKTEMRERYWKGEGNLPPWEYPIFYAEWAECSFARFAGMAGTGPSRGGQEVTAIERYSNIQMLMLVQSMTPADVPFLLGETYAIIPLLLVPRFFLEDKPSNHEGTYLLCIHYRLQTRERTTTTTIGFSLLSEAYANFSYPGVLAMAILLGSVMGWMTNMTRRTPGLSVGMCGSILFAVTLYTSEASAGIFITCLVQALLCLWVMAYFLARRTLVAPRSGPAPAVNGMVSPAAPLP